MHHKRLTVVLGLLTICTLGLVASLLNVATDSASAQATKPEGVKTTIVTVTAGKPTELGFKLSKFSALAAGPITFKVTNKGAITHNFKICTSPVTSSDKNSCTGKATPMLKAGQSATLTVTLKKKGEYEFLCAVAGHAGAGMKGLIGVGVKVAAQPTLNVPTTGGGPAANPTATPTKTTCSNPQTTTVNVAEFEYGFTLSSSTVPCGTITFNQTNTGLIVHNFDIQGVTGANGAEIDTGKSTTFTVSITPGRYAFVCDLPTHAGLGMQGTLTVTG